MFYYQLINFANVFALKKKKTNTQTIANNMYIYKNENAILAMY